MNFHFRSQSDSSDSGIIRYSDEQQSLERLFSPPSEDFIPLRDRNLPPSFFNPTANISGDGPPTNFHVRSASHFDQKPKLNGLHMRTQSVLAPMSSYVSTSNGSDGISNYTASSVNSSLIDNNNSNNSSVQQLNESNNNSINNVNTLSQNVNLNLNNHISTTMTSHNNNNDSHHHQQLHYRNYSSPAYVRAASNNFLPNQQQPQLHPHPHPQPQPRLQPQPQPQPPPQLPTLTLQPTPIGSLYQQVEINQIPQETFHQRTFSLQPAPLETEVLAVDPSIQPDQLYWNSGQQEDPQQYDYGW